MNSLASHPQLSVLPTARSAPGLATDPLRVCAYAATSKVATAQECSDARGACPPAVPAPSGAESPRTPEVTSRIPALIMLPMIPLEVDEVVAMLQHFKQARQRGDRAGSAWAIFWKGGSSEGCTEDERTPPLVQFPARPAQLVSASVWGMSAPATLIVCSLLGVLLMFLPAWFGISIEERSADVAHLGGALVLTVSVVSMGEVMRIGRYLNLPLALGVAFFPWLLQAP